MCAITMHHYVVCSRIPRKFLPSIILPRSWGIFVFLWMLVTAKRTASCHWINYIYYTPTPTPTHIYEYSHVYIFMYLHITRVYIMHSHISTCMYVLTHILLNTSAPSYLYFLLQGERFICKILLFLIMFLSTFGTILLLVLWVLL